MLSALLNWRSCLCVSVKIPLPAFDGRDNLEGPQWALILLVLLSDRFGNLGDQKPCEENNYLLSETGTWEDVKWLKSQTKLPIILKGILSGM